MKIYNQDTILAAQLCGLKYNADTDMFTNTFGNIQVTAKVCASNKISIHSKVNQRGNVIKNLTIVSSLGSMIKHCESLLLSQNIQVVNKMPVMCRVTTSNLIDKLVRVRSSNVWGYAMNVKHNKDKVGDVIVQFKGDKGGPGDVYIYYDVPIRVYRRWQSAQSKGHYFWQYIRNYYQYSKLTGDKRGKLPNAIN